MSNSPKELDKLRIDLERDKFEAEKAFKEREVSLSEKQHNDRSISTPHATIAGAFIALVSGTIGAGINSWSDRDIARDANLALVRVEETKVRGNIDLERSKQAAAERLERLEFETTLILNAIETGSREEAIRNLRFFLAAGFISDPDGKIASLADDQLPSKSEPAKEDIDLAASATFKIVDPSSGDLICNATAVSTGHFLTSPHCVETALEDSGRIVLLDSDGSIFDVELVENSNASRVSLIRASEDRSVEDFLSWERVRAPESGEEVYLLAWAPRVDERLFLRCAVTSTGVRLSATSDPPGFEGNSFSHSCQTTPGTSGSLVIAVKDNAPLGVHTGTMGALGVAALLSHIKTEFAFLAD